MEHAGMKMDWDYRQEIDSLLQRLFPIPRSLTGDGNRETLKILKEVVPLKILEYPSGQQVYDWVIPPEWRIREAWIKNSRGEKIVDWKKCNLHVVNYSEPVHRRLSFDELSPRLHTREDLPEAIPYRTSYYRPDWGFCLAHRDLETCFAPGEEYEVCIDAEKFAGTLTVGELLIPGKSQREYLLSTYICHPSLANDNLSGPVLTALLARELLDRDLNFSYRIIFVPETIGAIAYCANNEAAMKEVEAGLVVTTVGGPGRFGYKQSWQSEHPINAMIEETFVQRGIEFDAYPFDIHGSDERQYSSQGFRINVASVTKDKYYEYPQYHTSLDNLEFVSAGTMEESMQVYLDLLERMDSNLIWRNRYPHCEVMLSKHDLYPEIGGGYLPEGKAQVTDLVLWLLFHCDGKTSLHHISSKLQLPLPALYQVALQMEEKGVLERGHG